MLTLRDIIGNALNEASRKKFASNGMVDEVTKQVEDLLSKKSTTSFTEQIMRSNPDQSMGKTESKEEGMKRADDNANIEWKKKADDILLMICKRQSFLTVDDVSEELEKANVETHNRSALGAVMTRGKNNKWCFPTDRTLKAKRKEQHSCSRLIWQSILNPPSDA